MIGSSMIRRGIAVLILGCVAASVGAQSHEEFTNLKVLPKDIKPEELRGMMNGFTRALGVRCIYCHVGEEGKPFKPGAFALDDKPTKAKARVMIAMLRDLNDKYLPTLESRANPAIRVQCVTCHRGATQPRMLQDVLKSVYDTGGIDSTLARYQSLRDRYYGRFTYDFGEVPLADLANAVRDDGQADDAARLLSLNLDMNPASAFAKRQFAASAMTQTFGNAGADSGTAAYHALKARFGDAIVSEEMVNNVGYQLLFQHKLDPALAVLKLNVAEHPSSGNAYDSMGEAYNAHGDSKLALAAYTKSLELDPTNDNAQKKIVELGAKLKTAGKKKKK